MATSTWIDDHHLDIGGEVLTVGLDAATAGGRLQVMKPRSLVDSYLALIQAEQPRRIIELGTKEGGSAALLALAAEPELLVTVDLAETVPAALTHLVQQRDLDAQVIAVTGLDQADRQRLADVLEAPMGGLTCDLVIDDASHVLGPTRDSFELLFPRLRPGGIFIIEDWATDWMAAKAVARVLPPDAPDFDRRLVATQNVLRILNAPGASLPPAAHDKITAAYAERSTWDEPGAAGVPSEWGLVEALTEAAAHADFGPDDGLPSEGVRPMMDLAVQLVTIRALGGGIVDELHIDGSWILVRRGSASLDAESFSLADAAPDFFRYLA